MSKTWGTPTWLFFHSFAEQISDECYEKNKREICELLRMVCFHLPCYDCRKHARQYTKYSLSANNIHSKQQLKEYFFNFHNSVNVRLNKNIFNDLDQYKYSKLENIVNMFCNVYAGKSVTRSFHEQMIRKNIINNIKKFINNNSSQFRWI